MINKSNDYSFENSKCFHTVLLTIQRITTLYDLQEYYKTNENNTHYVFGYYKTMPVNEMLMLISNIVKRLASKE